jgi:hypothetical protein
MTVGPRDYKMALLNFKEDTLTRDSKSNFLKHEFNLLEDIRTYLYKALKFRAENI